MQYTRDKKLLLTVYFCFYFAVFLFLGIGHRTLLQVHPVFFHYNRDLAELMLIGSGLPRFMIAHPVCFAFADTLGFLLPIPLLGYAFRKDRFSPLLGWVFCAYVTLYLLLADLFWQIHHGPFILYVLLAFAFVTNREERFYSILRGCRYYFLYIFVSAAIWKTVRGAVFDGQEMSHILLLQHIDLLSSDCQTALCRFYAWLIGHPAVAQSLYIGAVLMESVFVVGFFTRRFDRSLLGLAVLFVAADLLVMRIPYWTLLLGGITLWMDNGRRRRGIVIYETTHHENLSALLDLSEAHFSGVTVFLTGLSYRNLSGQQPPATRWPRTHFVVQTTDESNRRFIGRLFRHIRHHRSSHLHLSTLDSNLLFFAFHLVATPAHISLTLHEVNAWFTRPRRTLRDASETLAKAILHRRIRHYTCFLPAMTEQLHHRLPKATAVFIPSRFYASPPPVAGPVVPFIIVISGSVDPNRRQYTDITPISHPIELVLLGDSGTPAGTAIVAALRPFESAAFRLVTYQGYIPESEYERQLTRAHLIWSPLNVHKTGSRGNAETYGLTTASGLTADILLNNIPALTPAGFVVPAPFKAGVISYSSPAEASAIIDRLINDPAGYYKLRSQIHDAWAIFSCEEFAGAFLLLTATQSHRPAR